MRQYKVPSSHFPGWLKIFPEGHALNAIKLENVQNNTTLDSILHQNGGGKRHRKSLLDVNCSTFQYL
jgi:hypothetical protein